MTRNAQRYRRACDYLAASMIYLRDNFLLADPLRPEHLKPRLLGHWGTCPGITFVYRGLNRLVRDTGQRTLLVTGPGHGAPAIHANLWMEGTHAVYDAALSRDAAGMAELVRRFSWPGGFPSHLSPEVPGVINEGGELGYALSTAFGAAADDPELLVACIVGDGEAETGPTAASWHARTFFDDPSNGTVLPILHLNGYKIASPTVYASMSDQQLTEHFASIGWSPRVIDVTSTSDPDDLMDTTLDWAHAHRAEAPMILLRSPKGWGLPDKDGDGKPLAGTFRAHQVPLEPDQLPVIEAWLRSYRPEELFTADGEPRDDLLDELPPEQLRLGRVPQANGGALRRDLPLPDLAEFAVEAGDQASPTGTAGKWLTRLMADTEATRNFRIVSPDELASNKLDAVLEVTGRAFTRKFDGYAENLAPDGRVLEVLSEHVCQGVLEGYLLTGRHGLFPCYEAFASIVDGMVNQYAKFLKMAAEVPWRQPIASLNYLLTSEGWRQEHNGYSHQGPGFINNLLTKKTSVTRIYLPPDANTLLVTLRDCLASTDLINLIVAGKNSAPQWLDLDAAQRHCAVGAGVWQDTDDPDVVLACAGGVPTVEIVAAAKLLRERAPELKVRVTNVVDLLCLAPDGLSDNDFAHCFADGVPVVFGFHGYPSAVHITLHGRPQSDRFHVHGYREEGTTTTPFDLLVSNDMSRYDLAADAARRVGVDIADDLIAERDELRARAYRDGEDPPEATQ
jgi:xylulose-5-phosphate/fructose-6-phosphate phosphoketolase